MAKDVNTMPYNRDAEMALLGCLLIDNEITAELVEKLSEDDFYQESHKYILRAMQRVFNNRKPVDLVTVSDELENEATLEKAGGIVYLTELAQIVPSAANYKSYYEIGIIFNELGKKNDAQIVLDNTLRIKQRRYHET